MAISVTIDKLKPPHPEDIGRGFAAIIFTIGLHLILAQLFMFKANPAIDRSNPIAVKLITLPSPPPSSKLENSTPQPASTLDVLPLISDSVVPPAPHFTPRLKPEISPDIVDELAELEVIPHLNVTAQVLTPAVPVHVPITLDEIGHSGPSTDVESNEAVIHLTNLALPSKGYVEKHCKWKIAGLHGTIKDCPNYRVAAKGDPDRRNKPIFETR